VIAKAAAELLASTVHRPSPDGFYLADRSPSLLVATFASRLDDPPEPRIVRGI
jgi:hypothetical protein